MIQTSQNNEEMSDEILKFAEDYLQPFKTHSRPNGTAEIVPILCPFCKGGDNRDENTFALSIDKGLYVCKRGSCGKRGRFEELADYFGQKSSFQRPVLSVGGKTSTDFVLPTTELYPPTEEAYDYFEKRKISRSTVDAFKIMADEYGNIVFPFYVNGINTFEKFRKPQKYRKEDGGPKEWRSKGAKPVLFGMDSCTFSQPLVITEGQIDAMSLYEAGIYNVVSVPSGCEDLSWIENCYDWLEKFKTYILFGDNDDPGRKMVQTVAKRLGEASCMIVDSYPPRPNGGECKDANEVLYFHGDFELLDMIENAKAAPVKGIIDLSTIPPYDPTLVPRIGTMIPALDETIGGLVEGGVTVFTGRSGDGKSTLSGLLLLNAIEQGHNVCAYSGELKKEKFQEWINLQCAGSDYIGLKYDPIKKKDVPVLSYSVQQRLMDYYKGHFYLFDNNEIFEHNQSESIISVFTTAVRRYGCKLFLVDNLMTSLSDADEETRAQGKFVNALKKFATKFGVHVLIVAHPRKTKAGDRLQKDDVGGSGTITNLADSVIVVERPNLRIIKNRDGGVNKLIECCYCGDSRRIYQMDVGDKNKFSWNKQGVPMPTRRADSLPEYGVSFAVTEPF